jgi:molybdenum cofactor biosynthesis enzyme MoaA
LSSRDAVVFFAPLDLLSENHRELFPGGPVYKRSSVLVDLVHPPPYGEVPFKHLGLACVAAGLHRAGIETRYHDFSELLHRRDEDFYGDLILRLSRTAGDMSDLPSLELLGEVLFPDLAGQGDTELASIIRSRAEAAADELSGATIVGLSFNTLTAYFTVALGRWLRERGVPVMLGGPLSTVAPVTELMLRLGAADAVLAGEGDTEAGSLARAIVLGQGLESVPGAIWLRDGVVCANRPAPPPDLELLPWPDLAGNVLDQFVPIAASRGCPRRCAYCSEPGLWPPGARRRRPAWIAAEMDARAGVTGLTDFHFHDDLLNGSRSWLEELVGELRGRGFTWESFFEPYRLDRPMLESMRDAGCRLVKYGVQSFSPDTLGRMRRPGALDRIVQTIVDTYEVGISTHFDMLIGHPGETEDDHSRNVRAIRELYGRTGDRLYFSLNPYYLAAGSSVERDPERYGVRVRFADLGGLPHPLAEAVAAGPPYPVGYESDVPRDTLMHRMDELAAILAEHGRDYLFLGKRDLVSASPRGQRMLRRLDEVEATASTCTSTENVRKNRPAVFVLARSSNIRLWPTQGNLELAAPAGASFAEIKIALTRLPPGSRVLVTGGEPTLDKVLAPVLAVCRLLGLICRVETNGIRCAGGRFAAGLRRRGLSEATVVLTATNADLADRLGGLPGSFELAIEGARSLVAAGVAVDLGLLLTRESLEDAERLADIAANHVPAIRRVRLLLAPPGGPENVTLPSRPDAESALDSLRARAMRLGLDATLEDRSGNPGGATHPLDPLRPSP